MNLNNQNRQPQQKQREQQRLTHQEKQAIETYRRIHGDYWRYDSADVYVPLEIKSIPAMDRVNRISFMLMLISGNEYSTISTELFTTQEPYTVEEYHDKFCEYDENTNRWIYKSPNNRPRPAVLPSVQSVMNTQLGVSENMR